MDFLLSAYEELKQLLDPGIALFIGILSILITKNSYKSSVARERLELVYHPLFLSIEPYLYKEIGAEDLKKFIILFEELELKHSLYIYPSLRYWVKDIKKHTNYSFKKYENDWIIICNYISKEYDKLCKLAYMPLRSTAYRVNNRQYKDNFSLFLGVIKLIWPNLVFITILVFMTSPKLVPIGYLLLFAWLINTSFNH